MHYSVWASLFLIALAIPLPSQAQGNEAVLSGRQAFALAEAYQRQGRLADAEALLTALTRDPNPDYRAEARFRKAKLVASQGRLAEAAVLYRAILDEKPEATPVRLELARVLAQMGDEAGARRALRQAQAAGLPPDVAAVVDQFANALRSTRRAGGSLELGFAPDSNINRATSARTLDTLIAPLTLSDDARAQSGIGAEASGQVYGRFPLAESLSLVPRLSGSGQFYARSSFDDLSASALTGVEWASGRDRLTPSIGRTWRWYGGKLYATTDTAALSLLHPIGRRAQLSVSGSAAHASYKVNPLQSGGLYDLSISGEYALSRRAGVGLTVDGTRQTARDPGYSTVAASVGVLGWRDIGRTTIFANASVRRTEGDARLFLFPQRRKEWLLQASGGAMLRWLTVHGFAPIVRIGVERNVSTVGLYDYTRVTTDFAITRAF